MKMKLLLVVTPLYIYHGFPTHKMFWQEKIAQLNMKNCERRNVRKHKEIKDGEKYITLDIYLDFCSLYKMKITSLEPKYCLLILGKGLNTSLGINTVRSSKKKKKARYAITNVSLNYIANIIKEFERFPFEGCAHNSFKHVPTDSHFYLARQLTNCMIRLNFHVGHVRTKITNTLKMNIYEMSTQNIPNLHICSADERKSKKIKVYKRK